MSEIYQCSCIECGAKIGSVKHCNELVCSRCGGQMRRADRIGLGRG